MVFATDGPPMNTDWKKIVVALLLLAGFVSAQAKPTTKPHNFDRWEKEISAYEEKDKTDPPAKGGVVFTGSSTILRWKTLTEDLPGIDALNRGFGGSEIIDAAHFADRIVTPYAP